MNITVLRCPCCQGEISLDANKEFGFCQYCGARVMLDNPHSAPTVVSISRQPEVENLLSRAWQYEQIGDLNSAEDYYNRVLDIDVNEERAQAGYNRVRTIITAPNVIIERLPSKNDAAARIVVKKGGTVLCKIPNQKSVSLMFPVGTHHLEFYQGGSLRGKVVVTIRTRYDNARILCRSKFMGQEILSENPHVARIVKKGKKNKRVKRRQEKTAQPTGMEYAYYVPENAGRRSEKSRFLLFVLWVLCGWGIFPFYYWYAGQKAGFLRFITLNYFTIGGLVDFFVIILGKFKDETGSAI